MDVLPPEVPDVNPDLVAVFGFDAIVFMFLFTAFWVWVLVNIDGM